MSLHFFLQDAGPMAHPVRPHSYIKVNSYIIFMWTSSLNMPIYVLTVIPTFYRWIIFTQESVILYGFAQNSSYLFVLSFPFFVSFLQFLLIGISFWTLGFQFASSIKLWSDKGPVPTWTCSDGRLYHWVFTCCQAHFHIFLWRDYLISDFSLQVYEKVCHLSIMFTPFFWVKRNQ